MPLYDAGSRFCFYESAGGRMKALYYGDNLDVMRRHIADKSVDLVYLDPPFNSARNYNAFFEAQDGTRSASQIQAFEDTWRWDASSVAAYKEMVELGGQLALTMEAFRTMVGESDMLAYLSMMGPRLVELRRVLRPTGSLYLHCDPTASHYLKLLLDAVFGPENFGNEIIWAYKYGGRSKKAFGEKHDVIFRYTMSSSSVFNSNNPAVRIPHEEASLKQNYRKVDEAGRLYREGTWSNGKVYRYYADDGRLRDDVWTDINSLHAKEAERLGYPTQKPLRLLEIIIEASSNPGDVVLDPFCGCGTAIDAAERLGRQWIGIDVTHLAVSAMKRRMNETYGPELAYEVHGEPTDVEGAFELAATDPYGFQLWSLGLVGARPAEVKKGADKGIDGRILFFDGPASKGSSQVVISIKGGKLQAQHVRDLRGVLEREKATMAVLISMWPPSKLMLTEAASAGTWTSDWSKREHPRMEIITVEQLMNGRNIDYPQLSGNVSMKRAQKYVPPTEPQVGLFD